MTGSVTFLGVTPPRSGLSQLRGLPEPTASLVDLLQEAGRSYLERIEAIDEGLSVSQAKHSTISLAEIGAMQRQVAGIREQIGRGVALIAELGGTLGERFPRLPEVLPSVESEFERLQDFSSNIQQVLRDLILLRNAEDANRIAEAANSLAQTSNRIAALANTSNIRMLGLAYIALMLGLVGAVVLIPNTAATILGMPSAGWVPGWWVDLIILALAVVPIVLVFSRPWILTMLRGISTYEFRSEEGLADLPEVAADGLKH